MRSNVAAVLICVLAGCCATAFAQEWGIDARTGRPASFATGAFGAERIARLLPPVETQQQQQQPVLVVPAAQSIEDRVLQTGGVYGSAAPVISAPYQPGPSYQIFENPPAGTYQPPPAYSTLETSGIPPSIGGAECFDCDNEPWHWQMLPPGLIYHSYLAGPKEPRFGGVLFSQPGGNTYLDGTLGARVGIFRYGNSADFRPQGWQVDTEGAAIIRQDLSENSDVDAYDFRIGVPVTYGWGRYQMKLAWYHTSAHLGDEFAIKHPDFTRINFSRNAFVWGHSFYLTDDFRIYGEVDYGYETDGGSEPWSFQTGFEYSPVVRGFHGAPFLAVNGLLLEENDFGGPFTLQTGWQWRPLHGGQLLRFGFHYQTGPSVYSQFFRDSEQQIGAGLWYDY